MDIHVVYQAVPIDLNEYFLPSGQSLLPTFDGNGNGNNRVDEGDRTKLYLLRSLAVALILSLAIVLPTVHRPCHNPEQLHLFKTDMPNAVRNDQHVEPQVLLKPTVNYQVIDQEKGSSNSYIGPIAVDKVINDDESLFWKYDYLGDDEGVFDLVDYIQEEVGDFHSKLVYEKHHGKNEVDYQDRHLENKDDNNEMLPEYNDIVPLNDDEFEAYEDGFALKIKADTVPKLVEGETDDTNLKADDKELGSEDTPDCDKVDGLYQGNNVAGTLLIDDDAPKQEEIAYA